MNRVLTIAIALYIVSALIDDTMTYLCVVVFRTHSELNKFNLMVYHGVPYPVFLLLDIAILCVVATTLYLVSRYVEPSRGVLYSFTQKWYYLVLALAVLRTVPVIHNIYVLIKT